MLIEDPHGVGFSASIVSMSGQGSASKAWLELVILISEKKKEFNLGHAPAPQRILRENAASSIAVILVRNLCRVPLYLHNLKCPVHGDWKRRPPPYCAPGGCAQFSVVGGTFFNAGSAEGSVCYAAGSVAFGSIFEISWVTNTALGSNGETQVQCRHVRSSRSGFQKISFQIRQHKLLENCTEIVISHTSSVKLPLNIAETKVSTLLCEVHPKELGVQLEPYASATGARVTGFSSRPGQLEQARVPLGARIIRIDESSVACETE